MKFNNKKNLIAIIRQERKIYRQEMRIFQFAIMKQVLKEEPVKEVRSWN
jgi:hypothetical protein